VDVNMWVARPTLTTVNVTGLPAFNVTCAGVNARQHATQPRRHRTFPAYARVESTMASWLFPWT